MIQFLTLHTWTGNWTNLHCLLRLPDRQRGLLYSHALSPHFCSKPDSLCTGPAGWRNCCHKIQRNLFHWAVQPESHQHHWKTHSYRGDILMIQIASKQPTYAKFVQLLWWIIHWPLTNCYFLASLPLCGFPSRARPTAGARTLCFPLQFHQRPLTQVVRWNGVRHGWSSGQHHSGFAAERIVAEYSLSILNRYVTRIESILHS